MSDFLAFMGRAMVQHFRRCTIHLFIVAMSSRAGKAVCTAKSSTVVPIMQKRAVGAELLTDSCVFDTFFV